jgi:hypothetical protein
MKVDFHTHTSFGLGKNSPAEMVSIAKRRGLDAIAITDLGTQKGWESFKPKGFTVIPGMEFQTDHGNVLIYGAQKPPEQNGLDFVLAWAKESEFLVVPSHFMDTKRESLGQIALEKFRIVEAINGLSSSDACKKGVTACTSAGVKFLSNSGAKSVHGLGEFYNTVDCEPGNWEEIVRAVQKEKFEPRIKFPNIFTRFRIF